MQSEPQHSRSRSDSPILSVEDLTTQFVTEEGIVRAVDGITFDVYPGEIVGIVGESGAGKSVAVQSILRLVEEPGRIVDGEVWFNDDLLTGFERTGGEGDPTLVAAAYSEGEMRTHIRGNEIAIIFQDPMESLNPVYTVGSQLQEIIQLNRDLGPREARSIARSMLREVGIPKVEERFDDYPHEFSGGMRQRVLISMALACEPSLIIADEPTTALDVTVEAQLLSLVKELQAEYDTSFIWVTHDMGVIAEICDRVNVMYLGEIIEQASVDELFHDTRHPYTEALLGSLPRPDMAVEELTPITGVMPEAINPPSGCRFHPRCPDARVVCSRQHPDNRTLSNGTGESSPHRAACFKNDVFHVGYEDSAPLSERGESQ